MDNEQQEVKTQQNPPQKNAGGNSKKPSNRPSANPMGGRNRAKSTVLANFEKNLKSNSSNTKDKGKIEVVGMDNQRFKNLLSMFEKKPEERQQEETENSQGKGKIDPNRFKAFDGNKADEGIEKKNALLDPLKNAPRVSIQDRIKLLMNSQEESKPKKSYNDPIIEKLRENAKDDDENEGENFSDDNLDISREEENENEIENENNDDLSKSESLSDGGNQNEQNVNTGKIANNDENNSNNKKAQNEEENNNNKKQHNDLDKSESLDDSI